MKYLLPPPLASYFDAVNAEDFDTMAGCFHADAVVEDRGEKKTLRGRDAIRQWAEQTAKAFRFRAQVQDVDQLSDGDITVAALVSGEFKGSPLTFTYRFTLLDSRIAALDIVL